MSAEFDEESAYAGFVAELRTIQQQCGDMLWCPADFWMIPKALWYERFGYETALMLVGLYPDHVGRLIAYSAATGRQRALLRARAITEGLLPKAILTGEDLCSQQGPMVSPAFLRQNYWTLVEWAIEPLLAVGAKIVWHCDGNYRPLLDYTTCWPAVSQVCRDFSASAAWTWPGWWISRPAVAILCSSSARCR